VHLQSNGMCGALPLFKMLAVSRKPARPPAINCFFFVPKVDTSALGYPKLSSVILGVPRPTLDTYLLHHGVPSTFSLMGNHACCKNSVADCRVMVVSDVPV
jgi:hypothetical protein